MPFPRSAYQDQRGNAPSFDPILDITDFEQNLDRFLQACVEEYLPEFDKYKISEDPTRHFLHQSDIDQIEALAATLKELPENVRIFTCLFEDASSSDSKDVSSFTSTKKHT